MARFSCNAASSLSAGSPWFCRDEAVFIPVLQTCQRANICTEGENKNQEDDQMNAAERRRQKPAPLLACKGAGCF